MCHVFQGRPNLCPFILRILTGSLFAALFIVCPASATAATSAHLWSQRFGGADSHIGRSIAVDASGNVFITGYFRGTVNFGGSDLTSLGQNENIFLAKFDAAGVHQWSQSFAALICFPRALAVDASGNVIITGSYYGSVNFGGSASTYTSSFNVFVAKFSPAGVHQWSSFFGDEAFNSTQHGRGVAVDVSGGVVITGEFQDTIVFGVNGYLTSAGAYDIFVAKFTADGVFQWARRFGDVANQYGYSVAADASGDVLVTGEFSGTINFGGSNLVSIGLDDIFVAKLDAAGVHQWSRGFGGLGDDTGYSVTADASGGVTVTGGFGGYFDGTVDFGGGPLTSAGDRDIFLAKFSSGGVHQWSQRFGNTAADAGLSVTTDASENLIVTGYAQGLVNFGGADLSGAGSEDIFVAKFSGGGIHQWSQRFGDASSQIGYSVGADASGNVVATGFFRGTVDFGGANLTSAGTEDIFLAKFGGESAEPTFVTIEDVGNDQGGQVKIRFTPSGFDDPLAGNPVDYYEAYRRDGTMPLVWTLVGKIPAHVSTEYLMAAPTLVDSTISNGQHYSAFVVRAVTTPPILNYDSPVDSGYSLDNLAPGIPTGFAYSAGALSWDRPRAADFDHFSVYGSHTSSFVSAALIDYTVAPLINVAASPYAYYFVTATDASGNEGKAAVVEGLSSVGGTPKSYVLSVSVYPSPFNPKTTIRYTLPSNGRVTIAVYDTRGVRVATLLDEEKPAGAYTVPWQGRDDSGGIVSSGVYFARLEFGGDVRAYKMVLLK